MSVTGGGRSAALAAAAAAGAGSAAAAAPLPIAAAIGISSTAGTTQERARTSGIEQVSTSADYDRGIERRATTAPSRPARRARRRLRRPVRPAHRPPGARADRVLRDRARTASPPPRSPPRRPAALILSGGPKSVHVEGAPSLDPAIYELGIPILGICYGAQLIAQQLGGTVGRGMRGEYGRAKLRRTGAVAAVARRRPRRPRRVDEPLRRDHRGARRASSPTAVDRRRAGRRARGRRPADLRRAVPPRGRPLAVRHGRAAPLPARAGRRARRRGRWRRSSTSRSTRIRAQVGDGRVICALSRRRRLGGRRGARAPGRSATS